MKTILYYSTGANLLSPSRIDGISRFARTKGWNLVSRSAYKMPLAELVAFWHPVGCVLDNGNGEFRERIPKGIPVVWLSRDPALMKRGEYMVDQDSVQTGRLAAAELIRSGVENFAYVGFHEKQYWSDQRLAGFREEIARHGMPPPSVVERFGADAARGGEVRRFLASLPKPVGVFCATDSVAEEVAGMCREAGIDVPRDAAIIGVDDYACICEGAAPTLSSVNPDFELGGYTAARLLSDLIDGKRPAERVVWHPPRGVVRRQSTQRFVRFDRRVSAGMEFIRVAVDSGLSVQSVADAMGCSRRLAEKLFRETTGDTILKAINDAIFDKACRMLRDGRTSVGAAADMLQISPTALRRIFTDRTGMNPLKWAKKGSSTSPSPGAGLRGRKSGL